MMTFKWWTSKLLAIICYFSVYFVIIKAGDECCRTGRIYGGRNECHMIPNINNVEPDRVPCLLQTTFCCLQYSHQNFCQRIGLNFVQSRPIQQYLTTIQQQFHNNNNGSMQKNIDQFWLMLRSRYHCYLEDDRESLCCVECTLGFVFAFNNIFQWEPKMITENLIKMNLSEWCNAGHENGNKKSGAFDVCCQETIKTINSSIRWCDLHPASCAHNCHEAKRGSSKIHCSCWDGYRLADDEKNCIDIDECQERTHDCNDAYETCSNTEGKYQCLPKINDALTRMPGLEITGNRNECSPGFYYNSTYDSCKDIDECALSKHNCSLNYQVCINKLGSYDCVQVGLECPKGFRRMTASTDFDTGCRDIDECREGLYNCDYLRENCENFIGSYACEEKSNITIRTIMNINDSTTLSLESFVNNFNNESQLENTRTNCPKGYHFVRFSYQCEDINECQIGQHNCDLSLENCVNFPGSYSCRSNIDDEENNGDELTINNDKNEMNEINSGLVVCNDGFVRNTILNICEDIDECRRTNAPCPENSLCQNIIGSYICHCKGECEDVDECERELSHCPDTMRCVNTLGSFECVPQTISQSSTDSQLKQCSEQKIYDPILKQCINENRNNMRKSSSSSIPIGGNHSNKCKFGERMIQGECKTVVCGPGFFYNETDKRCQDMNECLEYSPCRSYEKCTNTIGSYRCSLKCNSGYRLSSNGQSCEDINECANGKFVCPADKICKNRPGSYSCECLEGYIALRDGSCQDINECEQGDQLLCDNPKTQTCINTIGSYRCKCRDGYQEQIDVKMSNITKQHCVDVDECQNRTMNKCQHYCHNYAGSYKCSCRSGFKLSNDGYNCIDEDECQMFNGTNGSEDYQSSLCYYKCVNVPGSFRCICPPGYESVNDGNICRDIDECEQQSDICEDNEFCLNVRGSYRCILITCPQGYFFELKTKRCLRQQDGILGHRDLSKPISYSYNYLSIVSNIRIPKSLDYFDLVSMSGKVFSIPGIKYHLTLIKAKPGRYGVKPAMRENFILRRPTFDQIVVSLIKPLQGPQDVDLELTISLYPEDKFGGMSKALIYIVVSEYGF